MRTILIIKNSSRGGKAAAGARYISERERNPAREEPQTRPLFSSDRDEMKAKAADRYLAGDGRLKPAARELHHLIIAFGRADAEELERAGRGTEDRDRPYREVLRATMQSVARHVGATSLRWVAGVHRHTEKPHVHLLLHKEIQEEETGRTRLLHRLPATLLNGRDEQGRPTGGAFDRCLSQALDEVLRVRCERPDRSPAEVERIREISSPVSSRSAFTQPLMSSAALPARSMPEALSLPARGSGPEERQAMLSRNDIDLASPDQEVTGERSVEHGTSTPHQEVPVAVAAPHRESVDPSPEQRRHRESEVFPARSAPDEDFSRAETNDAENPFRYRPEAYQIEEDRGRVR